MRLILQCPMLHPDISFVNFVSQLLVICNFILKFCIDQFHKLNKDLIIPSFSIFGQKSVKFTHYHKCHLLESQMPPSQMPPSRICYLLKPFGKHAYHQWDICYMMFKILFICFRLKVLQNQLFHTEVLTQNCNTACFLSIWVFFHEHSRVTRQ